MRMELSEKEHESAWPRIGHRRKNVLTVPALEGRGCHPERNGQARNLSLREPHEVKQGQV